MNTKTSYGIKLLILGVVLSGCAVRQLFAQMSPRERAERRRQEQAPPPDYTRSPLPAKVCTPQVRGLSIGMTKEAFTKLMGFNYFNEERPVNYYPLYPKKISLNLNYEGSDLNAKRAQSLLYKAQRKSTPTYDDLINFPPHPFFDGIERITFGFHENRLVYLYVHYSQNFSREGEFFEKIVSSFNLPRDGWDGSVRIGQFTSSYAKTLICNGAAITVTFDGPPQIKIDGKLDLRDIMARENDRIKEQERLEEQKKRDTFKPE